METTTQAGLFVSAMMFSTVLLNVNRYASHHIIVALQDAE